MRDRTGAEMYQFLYNSKVQKNTPIWLTFLNFIYKIKKEMGGER